MTPASNKKYIVFFIAVLCWTFWAFGPTLQNGFVNYDDDVHLLKNPFIRSLDAPHLRLMFSTTVNKTYIPLSLFSFAWEHEVWGFNPFIFHLHNLLLHLVNTALVIALARFFGLSRAAGLLSGLIFGVHPMHVESVAWVTERKDVLYAFFYLLAVLCYLTYLRRGGFIKTAGDVLPCAERSAAGGSARFAALGLWIMVLVCGLLSALSKPMALSLPFVLLLLDWYFKRRLTIYAWMEKFICGVLLFPVVWVSYALHIRHVPLQFPESLLVWVWCLTFHLKKFFYPDFFVVFYVPPLPVTLHNGILLQGLLSLGLLAASLVWFRRQRLVLLAFFWYILSAFFLFRFDYGADSHVVADRFMYLPSLGFCWLSAWLIVRWYQLCHLKRLYQILILTGTLAMVLFLSGQTRKQAAVWENGVSLWKHQLETQWDGQPGLIQALVLTKYADAFTFQAEFISALNSLAVDNKGMLVNTSGERPGPADAKIIYKVIGLYRKALMIRPRYAPALFGLGRIFYQLGQMSLSEEYLRQTVALDPGHFNAYFYLGKVYFDAGRIDAALAAFRKAGDVSPGNQALLQDIIEECRDFLAVNPQAETVNRELQRWRSR